MKACLTRRDARSKSSATWSPTASPSAPHEVAQEFRWRNEKVKIDYALIKPADLAATIHPSRRRTRRLVREKFLALPDSRKALRPLRPARSCEASRLHSGQRRHPARLLQRSTSTSTKSKTAFTSSTFSSRPSARPTRKSPKSARRPKTSSKQAKHGANFEDLAKKYSEDDATKAKGGDLGWIVEGQTVPEFQQAAFSLPKGSISDLVKTQYGFHIIKVLDRETAHTKSFEEVRDSILQPVLDQKVNAEANDISNQMAAAVRQSDRQSLDDLAKKFNLDVGETPAGSITDPLLPLGNSAELHQILFGLHPGELSAAASRSKAATSSSP